MHHACQLAIYPQTIESLKESRFELMPNEAACLCAAQKISDCLRSPRKSYAMSILIVSARRSSAGLALKEALDF